MKIKLICLFVTSSLLVTITPSLIAFPGDAREFNKQNSQNNRIKAAQCNQVVAISNQAVKDVRKFSINGRNNANALTPAATALENYAKQMEKLSLTDRQLQSYRLRFVTLYRNTSRATRNFVNAFNSGERSRIDLTLQQLRTATKGENQLIQEINRYCSRGI